MSERERARGRGVRQRKRNDNYSSDEAKTQKSSALVLSKDSITAKNQKCGENGKNRNKNR